LALFHGKETAMHEGFHGDHSHEHPHAHSHEHTHDGVAHTHEHSHGHHHDGHGHAHSHDELHAMGIPHEHDHGADPAIKETRALLDFMLHHNIHHAEELEELAGKLREIGRAEAAERIAAAVTLFNQGNAELNEALMLVSE